mmetsp:Transcript_18179/g.38161  ORF Transcript_18179/g.38161 Transcript_18179/m.38161 type:complete len:546 (-) Transcript_18179:401-2038(-)
MLRRTNSFTTDKQQELPPLVADYNYDYDYDSGAAHAATNKTTTMSMSMSTAHKHKHNTDRTKSNKINKIPECDVEDTHSNTERSDNDSNNNNGNNNNDGNNNGNHAPLVLTGGTVTFASRSGGSGGRRKTNHGSLSFVGSAWSTVSGYMNSTRIVVLLVLCLQNSMFTILRRYSQGVLQEDYSKHELLLVAELIKIVYSAWMISKNLAPSSEGDRSNNSSNSNSSNNNGQVVRRKSLSNELVYLVSTSRKMFVLALIYGSMNILSFISLRNISAGIFTIVAQCKIMTTATFSTIMLKRQYSWTKWRALIALMLGVLLFSEPIWGDNSNSNSDSDGNVVVGTAAVLIEVTLSGFASIYFEKVIKTDPLNLGIWERNFQLALGSVPVYLLFIAGNGGGTAGFFGGWSWLTALLSALGAAGGLLVALSIKYGDSILKTLATTGAIILTGVLDHLLLDGPLTPSMMIAGVQVIIAICNYTFDASPTTTTSNVTTTTSSNASTLSASTTTTATTTTNSIPSGGSEERPMSNTSNNNDEETTQFLLINNKA